MTAYLGILILVLLGFIVGILPRLLMLVVVALSIGFLIYGLYGTDSEVSVDARIGAFIALNALPFLLVGFCVGLWRKRRKRLMGQERRDA
ncbi:MAG: hypothetical protein AB3N12_07995 [Ruegeria sp.]